jgi:hypothetical protein
MISKLTIKVTVSTLLINSNWYIHQRLIIIISLSALVINGNCDILINGNITVND